MTHIDMVEMFRLSWHAAEALIGESSPHHTAVFSIELEKVIDSIWDRLEGEGHDVILADVVLALASQIVGLVEQATDSDLDRRIMLTAINVVAMQMLKHRPEGDEEESDERVTH